MSIFVVIPAYNEEETIYEVIKEVILEISNVIVINDCSIDNTEKLALKAGAQVINLEKNYGYDFAIEQGIKQALKMFESGASIIDVGGESTKPGSKGINLKLEWNRINKILKS